MIEFVAIDGRRYTYRLSAVLGVIENGGEWWVCLSDSGYGAPKVSEQTAALVVKCLCDDEGWRDK